MKKPRVPAAVRITSAIAGPVLLTVGYFTLPLDIFGKHHEVLSWIVLGGLIVAFAVGMLLLTRRTLLDEDGHPGAAILVLSWASLLVFSASYWALSTEPNQFSGLHTRLDALYFTAITLATVGYGDIVPTGQTSRTIVLVMLLYSFAFLAAGITATSTRMRKKLLARHKR